MNLKRLIFSSSRLSSFSTVFVFFSSSSNSQPSSRSCVRFLSETELTRQKRVQIFCRKPPSLAIGAYLVYTKGRGPVCECTVECTLGEKLSGTACLTEKPLQRTLNRRLLQVMGAFYKRSKSAFQFLLTCRLNDWKQQTFDTYWTP